jgi:serine/threonine protein kinase
MLTIGSRIGAYEVRSPLGEGGMGVVFRAHDTKLLINTVLDDASSPITLLLNWRPPTKQ